MLLVLGAPLLYNTMAHLPYLRILLQNLPDETGLPLVAQSRSTIYNFTNFLLEQREIEGTEELESFSKSYIREIRAIMRMDSGDAEFLERGPDLVCVVDVLEQYLQLFSSDEDIENIMDELVACAKGYYVDAGISVSVI